MCVCVCVRVCASVCVRACKRMHGVKCVFVYVPWSTIFVVFLEYIQLFTVSLDGHLIVWDYTDAAVLKVIKQLLCIYLFNIHMLRILTLVRQSITLL